MSKTCAEEQLLPAVRAAAPDTLLLADGFSCRTQLEQLAGRKGRHLAEALAEHYGPRGGLRGGPRGDLEVDRGDD